MITPEDLLRRRRRVGWAMICIGVLATTAGLLAQPLRPALGFDPRLASGIGIVLLGYGVGSLIRGGLPHPASAASRRLGVEALDERNLAIANLAGRRAFITSSVLTGSLMMWASVTGNGQLPPLSADVLWYALVTVFVVPMLVYIASVVHANQAM